MQTEKWKNYRMWSYVKDELPGLLASDDAFSSLDTGNCSIFGHSMGGHGEVAGTGMQDAGPAEPSDRLQESFTGHLHNPNFFV